MIQKAYKQTGVTASQSDSHSKTFNWKNLSIYFMLAQFGISSLAYFIFKANSIGQYADSFYMFLSVLTCVAFRSVSISKIDNISKLIENCEEFIEKSKWNKPIKFNKIEY